MVNILKMIMDNDSKDNTQYFRQENCLIWYKNLIIKENYRINIQNVLRIFTLIILVFVILQSELKSDTSKLDSLLSNYHNAKTDSMKINNIKILVDYAARNYPDTSKKYLVEFEALAESSNNSNHLIEYYLSSSLYYAYTSDLMESNKVLLEALNYVDESTEKLSITTIYSTLGINHLRLSHYEKAIEYLEKSAKIARENNFTSSLANNFITLGLINNDVNKLIEAEKYYKDAIDLYLSINDEGGLATAYNNLANLHAKNKKFNEAVETLAKSIEIHKKTGNYGKLGSAYHNQAAYLFELEKYDETEMMLLKSLEIKKSTQDQIGIGISYLALAELYTRLEKYPAALININIAIEIFKKTHALNLLMRTYSVQEEIYLSTGNYEKSYQAQKNFHLIKDSIFTTDNERIISELNAKYDLASKEMENVRLSSQAERQKLLIIIIALVLIFVTVLLMLFLLKNKRIRKINEVLEESKLKIEKQNYELELLNSELFNTNQNLIELNHTKDKFFSIISHDLKGPISSQNLLIETIKTDFDKLTEDERQEYLELVFQSAENTFNLLENLLVWGKIQMNGVKTHFTQFHLHHLVKNTLDNLKFDAEIKHINIENNCPLDIELVGDIAQLSTIVRNIGYNSIKFTPEKGLVKIDYESNESEHIIKISDSGIGMSEELINDLFKIDKSVSRNGTNNEKGTGLGLIICKEFIDMHQGRIWVESNVGKGTTFFVAISKNIQQYK